MARERERLLGAVRRYLEVSGVRPLAFAEVRVQHALNLTQTQREIVVAFRVRRRPEPRV